MDIRTRMDIGDNSRIAKLFIYLIMAVFTVLALYPLFWLAVQSFKTTQ